MTVRREPPSPSFALGALELVPDVSGALYAPDERAVIVADLHFEKGSALARRGSLLPPYDSRETLSRLGVMLARLKPKTVIALGDTWHDGGGHARMDAVDAEAFAALRLGREWVLITGNHDPEPPRDLGAQVHHELMLKGVILRHQPSASPLGPEIAGHLHPAAKVSGRGRSVRRKCFMTSATRCILPAFGAYAGGLNVLDKAFRPLFAPSDFTAHVMGADRIYAISPALLLPD